MYQNFLAPEGTGWALGAEGAFFFYYYFGAEGAFFFFLFYYYFGAEDALYFIVLQGKQYQGCSSSSMNLQQYDVLVVWF